MAQTKLSIDLLLDPDARVILPQETLLAIASGCLETLKRLGELGRLVEVFRVTFVRFGEEENAGLCIRVYYKDPLGEKAWFGTDYRFMGSGSSSPSSVEIADALCKDLPHFMRELLARGAKKLAATQYAYEQFAQAEAKT